MGRWPNKSMAAKINKYSRRRAFTTYTSTVIGISLVLYMLSILGWFLINAQKVSTYVKENVKMEVYIKENVKDVEIKQLEKSIAAEPYTKAVELIDKEEAARIVEEDIGDDFIQLLGYNPLLASLDVYVNADYATNDSITWIAEELQKNPKIAEVEYRPDLLAAINENSRDISIVILGISILLLIIAVALINNTIRLAIYSKRFLIKSMQLVGATSWFIQRPFILNGVFQGFLGALIAISYMLGSLYFVEQEFEGLFVIEDLQTFGLLFGAIILIGIILSWIFTSLAVRKFLRLKVDDLY